MSKEKSTGTSDISRTTLIGRMVAAPELRHTNSGKAVTTFTTATNRGWKDAKGEFHSETTYHNCVVWGAMAESIAKYGAKGRLVYVEGSYGTRSYKSKRYVDVRPLVDFAKAQTGKTVKLEALQALVEGLEFADQSTSEMVVTQLKWLNSNPNAAAADPGDEDALPTPEDVDSETEDPDDTPF